MAVKDCIKQEEIERICSEYKKLNSVIAVCKITHHSSTTVCKYLRENGLARGRGGNQDKQQKITDEQILKSVGEMTRQQIAEKYGVHVANLDKRMKHLGVHAQYNRKAQKALKKKETMWHWTPGKAEMVRNKQGGRFELVEFKEGRFRIKCVTCGFIIERASSTIRQKKCLCDKCEERRKNEIELANERIKLMRSFYAVMELKKAKTCIVCGSEYHSQFLNQKYCSDRCRKKWKRAGGYRERAKKYGVEYKSGITLMKVFNRDKGICQLCGKPVDWHDNSWGESFGAMYPTVDHITAFANGGGHTWDNVQLAHAICNSYKRDLITA